MVQLAHSLRVLLIAVFVAATMVGAGVSMKADASVTMAPMVMAMAAGPTSVAEHDCAKCASQMALEAGCTLTCGLSMIAALPDLGTPAFAVTALRFDAAVATATGLAPPPAFTPPRTTSLI